MSIYTTWQKIKDSYVGIVLKLVFYLAIMFSILFLLVGLLIYNYYKERALPGVTIAGVQVAGQTRDQMIDDLTKITQKYESALPVELSYGDHTFFIATPSAKYFEYEIEKTANLLLNEGKEVTWQSIPQQWYLLWRNGLDHEFLINYQPDWLDEAVASMAGVIDVEAIPAQLIQSDSTATGVLISDGEDGLVIDSENLITSVKGSLARLSPISQTIPTTIVSATLSEDQKQQSILKAQQLLGSTLLLTFTDQYNRLSEWSLSGSELLTFLKADGQINSETIQLYLEETAAEINTDPSNARFLFNESLGKVEEFQAATVGILLDVEATSKLIQEQLFSSTGPSAMEVTIVVQETPPEITNDMANDLGITTLLGRGESTYVGSIASRVHNVSLAATKISGTLVKPGNYFSYNDSVGDISGTTGFQSAYVIMNGKTELGDGGGVCQDSTTLFRAVLDAGLPITEWRNHSYRVGYYEQNSKPGLDATVYAPSTDFVFLNDTPGHILVEATADTSNRSLTISIYGTDDGRVSRISNHVVWDITPPLPDQYTDDPSLPAGEIKQVDWKAGGAKARFDYKVTRNGETLIERTFTSIYRPWSAKFLRGTGT